MNAASVKVYWRFQDQGQTPTPFQAESATFNGGTFINNTTRRIVRVLELDGYARIDYRLSPDGRLYFLEANPNPEIAEREEFASAAKAAGLAYPALLQKVVELGLARRR